MTTETPAPPRSTTALTNVQAGAIIARSTLRDSARRRGSWTTTILTGVLFALLVVGGGSMSERLQQKVETISFKVAVEGDLEGAHDFLSRLKSERLIPIDAVDAKDEVAGSRAATGIKLADRLDEKMRRGESSEVAAYYRGGSDISREAYNTVILRLQELQLDLLPKPVDVAPAVTIEERQVRRDERVNRLQFARTLGALAAILCLGVVSSVAGVLGRSRERRSIEPLLLLPFPRTTVAWGTAAGALPVAILQLLGAVVLLILCSMLPLLGLSLSPASAVEIFAISAVGVLLLGALACSAGCLAGVLGSGSDDAVSVGDFFSLPFVGVGVLLFLLPGFSSSAITFAIPIVGPALLIRDGAAGELSVVTALIAILSTMLWCYLLLRMAARRLDGERTILRGTR